MHIHEWHLVCICIMARHTKNTRGRKLSLQQEVGHFDSKFPFHPHFHALYFNELLLQIEHHRFPIHSVSSTSLEREKLSKAFASAKHGGCHGAIHSHASSPYNFNIQFPMYTKFITPVYNVTLIPPRINTVSYPKQHLLDTGIQTNIILFTWHV